MTGDQAEPKIGDVGNLEDTKELDMDLNDDIDVEEVKKEIANEESQLDVRDSELAELIKETKIDLSETQMRNAE